MADRMTWEERWERDGDRWRYIYLLECELEKRSIRRGWMLGSLALNLVLIASLIWQIFGG